MLYKQNLHVHTTYCDGNDTPEEMLEEAIRQGFDSIGFSGHSFMRYSPGHSMTMTGTEDYKSHITRLKKEYAEKIRVFLGLEYDMYSNVDMSGYDYLIGSVHYLRVNGEHVGFDRSMEQVREVIDTHFDGDGMAYAKMFYETLAKLPEYGKFDILGHTDLICKHSENALFFDTFSPKYRAWALDALEALRGKIPFFEVNTGAISRGYRTTPYPAPFLLDAMREMGFGAVITSDCHDRRALSCFYGEAEELLRAHGFKVLWILTDKGFVPTKL